jgi:hypothetical protein
VFFLFVGEEFQHRRREEWRRLESIRLLRKCWIAGPQGTREILVFSVPSAFKSTLLRGNKRPREATTCPPVQGPICIRGEATQSLRESPGGGLEDHNGLFKAAVSYSGAVRLPGSAS